MGGLRLDHWSLRARLLVILTVLLIVGILATGWTASLIMRTYLIGQVDERLDPSVVQKVFDEISRRESGALMDPFGEDPTDDTFVSGYVTHLQYNGGRELTLPRGGLKGVQPAFPDLTVAEVKAANAEPMTLDSVGHQYQWRAVSGFLVGQTSVGLITIALPLEPVDNAVARLRWLTVFVGAGVTLLCGMIGYYAIRRALRPLTEVESTAAAIAGGDLSSRVPEQPVGTEVGRLTASLNGMLTQIESAFHAREASEARTRRFAADASHELRTPLTAIRGFAELYRQGAVREPDDVARTMSRIEDESRRMGALVDDLLLLARLDEQRPGRRDPVDLLVLAADAVEDARAIEAGTKASGNPAGLTPVGGVTRRIALVGLDASRGPSSALVIGDEDRLRQVVTNLIGNAVRHTPPGSPVEVAVGVAPGEDGAQGCVIEVRDHGPGLGDDEQAEKVFERFYRADPSRQRGRGGGTGLGLSIVAAVSAQHGGSVSTSTTPGGGATFRVWLPSAILS